MIEYQPNKNEPIIRLKASRAYDGTARFGIQIGGKTVVVAVPWQATWTLLQRHGVGGYTEKMMRDALAQYDGKKGA